MWRAVVAISSVAFATLLPSSTIVQASAVSEDLYSSKWYDWGFHGVYPRQQFESFSLRPPQLNFLQWSDRCEDGYTLMQPRGSWVPSPGPVMMDPRGELVWMETKYGQAMDLKVQTYKGQQYLTFWTGNDSGTFGKGVYYMLDESYEVFKTVQAANGLMGDLHEFNITKNNTALLTAYEPALADLSGLGVEGDGWIYDSIFQEIDLETGECLFEWRSSQHYSVEETRAPINKFGRKKDDAFDYFHINSIDKDDLGNYYISSRYMHTVTCIRPDGEICWILGGARNGFTDLSDGAATNFSWQHHMRIHENNTVTIFDNGAYDHLHTAEYTRGLLISLDLEHMTAALKTAFVDPGKTLAPSQGSVQILPETGNALVGWGHSTAYTEFTIDGEVLCDVHIAPRLFWFFGWAKSYRAFRTSDWIGRPNTPPMLAMKPSIQKLFVSWNGATEVHMWRLQGAKSDEAEDSAFANITHIKKTTFETAFDTSSSMPKYLRAIALDKKGNILGATEVISRETGQLSSGKYALGNTSGWYMPYGIFAGFMVIAMFCLWKFGSSIPGAKRVYRTLAKRLSIDGKDVERDAAPAHELKPLYQDDEDRKDE